MPLAEDRLYRLDANIDHAPETPRDRTGAYPALSQVADGQHLWPLDFEVDDDFGLGDARA
ncbi:MAG: hypothetical protein R3F08_04165 [Dokdonella sp.]